MKKKIVLLLILLFVISVCSCSNGDYKSDLKDNSKSLVTIDDKSNLKDNSKVLVTVDDVSITQQHLDGKKWIVRILNKKKFSLTKKC